MYIRDNNIRDFLQNYASDNFTVQELWIDQFDNFWGFEEREDLVLVTYGHIFKDEGYFRVEFETQSIEGCDIDELIGNKIENGYECFAMQLRA